MTDTDWQATMQQHRYDLKIAIDELASLASKMKRQYQTYSIPPKAYELETIGLVLARIEQRKLAIQLHQKTLTQA